MRLSRKQTKVQSTVHGPRSTVKVIVFLCLGVLVSWCLAGCGYTTRSMIADRFHTIYVEQFVNKIDITKETDTAYRHKINRPALETDITKSVINAYLFDGNLMPVRKESADLALKGKLVEFRRDALRYTDDDEVQEYRLNLVVDISLWDKREGKLVWEENNFTGDTTYFTMGPSAKAEDIAINDAIKDLSRRIIERTVEQW
ncbi:MAG: LPS assembly lipoprotein LptE [Candidatus Omnitrophota bacterium]